MRSENQNHSPGALTAKRFFRNRLAVVGLGILVGMFLFSFLGGAVSPYAQDQVFYRLEQRSKAYAEVTVNQAYRFTPAPEQTIDTLLQAQLTLALQTGQLETDAFRLAPMGKELYAVWQGQTLLGIAHKALVYTEDQSFSFVYGALEAYAGGSSSFTAAQGAYTLDENGVIFQDRQQLGYVTQLIIRSQQEQAIPQGLFEAIRGAVAAGGGGFSWQDRHFVLVSQNQGWQIREETATRVWDAYARPSRSHLLGTDKNGMDVLTRLMYGGRVSLVIGFVVVLIAAALGVLLGGTAGYFGGWTDQLIMRLVDVFYCIPSTPLLIILGAAMDALRVPGQTRMLLLMLVLGLLSWPAIARLVRGQILSLREQEFMTAAEAVGLRAHRRIFRHLIPNVVPQLIVVCTMNLGSTILTEATLSFLGLGVKFPFASWGNIMNDVANAHVLTSYWFVWIPAGISLVLTVLGFNFVGDGLRDAYDPKMKR